MRFIAVLFVTAFIACDCNLVSTTGTPAAKPSTSLKVFVESPTTTGAVILPVMVSGINGRIVAGGSLVIKYGNAVPMKVIQKDTLTQGFLLADNPQYGDELWKFSFASPSGFIEDGVLFYIVLDCKKIEKFQVTGYLFDEKSVRYPVNEF